MRHTVSRIEMGNREDILLITGDSERSLYEAIRGGDQSAFACYYESSMDRLVTLIERITGDSEEARNIAQDTFIKLWQHRERIDPTLSLDGFISTVAWNAALNFLRRRRVHARYHAEQLHTQSGDSSSGEQALVATQTRECIENVIRNMPSQRRRVFEMSREEHLTYNEIALKLGLSYNTVMNHMKLALQDIRGALTLVLLLLFLR